MVIFRINIQKFDCFFTDVLPPRKRRKYNKIGEKTKEIIIEEHKSGGNFIGLADRLGVNRRTAYDIVKKQTTINKPRGGVKVKCVKITSDLRRQLLEYLETHNDATLAEMRRHINNALSTSSIARILDRSLISMKQLRPKPVGQDTPENLEKRKTFATDYMTDHGHRIHIDESNFNLFLRRSRGRAPRGQRAFRTQRNSRGKNINILLAIDDSTIILHKSVIGSTKDVFGPFMTELSNLLEDENCTFYLDNAPIHRKAENYIGVRQNHTVRRFDAAYSPELNPVEGCFSVIKSCIKRELRNTDPTHDTVSAQASGHTLAHHREQLLLNMIGPAIESLTRDKLRGFYRYVDEWIQKALVLQPFGLQPWFLNLDVE